MPIIRALELRAVLLYDRFREGRARFDGVPSEELMEGKRVGALRVSGRDVIDHQFAQLAPARIGNRSRNGHAVAAASLPWPLSIGSWSWTGAPGCCSRDNPSKDSGTQHRFDRSRWTRAWQAGQSVISEATACRPGRR